MEEKKEVAKIKPTKNALQSLAARLEVSPEGLKSTLMKTAFKECKNDADFISAVIVANTYGLNPLLGEIYAFPSKGGGVKPIVPVDGWISLVNRRKEEYDGVELIENFGEKENVSKTKVDSITATFHLKNREHPVVVTEYMEECYDGTKGPWKKWPRRMLRHKAYIQGARIAFGFSGIYDPDEAERIVETQFEEMPPIKKAVEKGESPEKEQPKKEDSKYAEMLKDFAAMKTLIGEEAYYKILGAAGFEKSNQVRTLVEGKKILTEMANCKDEK